MNTPRLDPRAARVVAWHNRHPLARRITAAQVQGIGFVAVPFFGTEPQAPGAAPRPGALAAAVIGQAQASAVAASLAGAGGSETENQREAPALREPAAAHAKQAAAGAAGAGDEGDVLVIDTAADPPAAPPPVTAPVVEAAAPLSKPAQLRAAFIEDFIAPISRRAAARFITRHGVVLAEPPADEPLREVAVAKASPADEVVILYTGTAAIEVGARRVRVLLAPGPAGAVLGPRLLDRQRIVALFVAVASMAAAATWALLPGSAVTPLDVPNVAAATAVAVAPVAAVEMPAPAPAPTPMPAPAAVPAPPAIPAPSALPPRELRPLLDDATKAAARQAVADLRAALPAPSAASAASAAPAAAVEALPPAGQPLFAVTSRVLRTQAESEQFATAARALLAPLAGKARTTVLARVELMPAGADWRVVAWPYTRADDAERARVVLASRGLRVQVVNF